MTAAPVTCPPPNVISIFNKTTPWNREFLKSFKKKLHLDIKFIASFESENRRLHTTNFESLVDIMDFFDHIFSSFYETEKFKFDVLDSFFCGFLPV